MSLYILLTGNSIQINMSEIINKVIYGAIGLTVMFLLMSTIVLPQFNIAYNTAVTGLSSATLQGMFLLVMVLALIGFSLPYIKSVRR